VPERAVAVGGRLVELFGRRLVQQGDVDPVQPEPLKARLQRRDHPVAAEVPEGIHRRGVPEDRLAVDEEPRVRRGFGAEDPADLRGDDRPRAVGAGEGLAKPRLCQSHSVNGSRVEIADSVSQRLPHYLSRVRLGHHGEQVPEGATADTDSGQLDPGLAELHCLRSAAGTAGTAVVHFSSPVQATARTGLPLRPGTGKGNAANRTRWPASRSRLVRPSMM